jgi:SAM-dependent methyltransferase
MVSDERALRTGQYADGQALAARKSIYAYQRPRLDLTASVAARLGAERVTGWAADLGAATGRNTRHLAAVRSDLRWLALDLSHGMLAAAPDSLARVQGSIGRLPLPDAALDAAVAMHVLHHAPAALGEIHRVLRPGGMLAATTNATSPNDLWDCFRDAGLDRAAATDRWPLETAADALRAAGFTDVRVATLDYELDLPAAALLVAYLDSCRTAYPDIPDAAWADIRARLAESTVLDLHGRTGMITGHRPQ